MKAKIISLCIVLILFSQTVAAAADWPFGEIGWDTAGTGGAGVRIAVIDTGISTVSINPKCLVQGKNYIDPGASTEDKVGHGTAVAGILVGAEKQGLRGVAPDAVLVPLVCSTMDTGGEIVTGDCALWAQAIRDAVDEFDCKVINLSMGTAADDEALRSEVAYAEKCGAVVVSAVGNDTDENAERIYYPAGYATVLGVAALNEKGEVAAFSQRNASVALCAPGVNLKVATLRGKTMSAFGTSYATAYVSGAAALLLSLQSNLKPEVVRRILCSSAKDLGVAGYDRDSGWGVLQIDTAMTFAKKGVSFRDTAADSWYLDAVRYVTDGGVFGGTSVTAFNPDGAMTRGMLAAVLGRLDERSYGPIANQGSSFRDVNRGGYYAKYIAWAQQNGIITGTGNNRFEPDRNITREEMALILYHYLKFREISVPFDVRSTGMLNDKSNVSPWAVKAVEWVRSYGLMNGVGNNSFAPKNTATRVEVAQLICNLIKLYSL